MLSKHNYTGGINVFEILHPEKPENGILLGNIELDSREKQNFNLVKQETGLKTIRRGLVAYDENGKKMPQCNGICDIYGPYPLFIEKTEFEDLQKKNPKLTPDKLFRKIIKSTAHKGRLHGI